MCVPAMTLKPALGVDKAVGRYAAAEVEGRRTGIASCMENMTWPCVYMCMRVRENRVSD